MAITFAPGQGEKLDFHLVGHQSVQYDRAVYGSTGFTAAYWRRFKALQYSFSYQDFKELGYHGVTPLLRAEIRDPNTKYIYLSGHGDWKRVTWGAREATMYAQHQAVEDLQDRPPPLFCELMACDGLTHSGKGTFAHSLTKGYSSGSCVIGYSGMAQVIHTMPSFLGSVVWPAVRQFYDDILSGAAFYPAYQKAISDHEDADWVFKFAGDQSPDLSLPHRTPSFSAPVYSVNVVPHQSSITLEFSISSLGSEWATLHYWALMYGGFCHRAGSGIITKPGHYVSTLEEVKPGSYQVSCMLSNSLYLTPWHKISGIIVGE